MPESTCGRCDGGGLIVIAWDSRGNPTKTGVCPRCSGLGRKM